MTPPCNCSFPAPVGVIFTRSIKLVATALLPPPVGLILPSRMPQFRHRALRRWAIFARSSRVKVIRVGSRPYLSFWAISGPPREGQPHLLPRVLGPGPWALLLPLTTWPASVTTIHTYHLPVQAPASPSPAPFKSAAQVPRPCIPQDFRPRKANPRWDSCPPCA